MKPEKFTAGIFLCVITGMLALTVFSFVFLHTERIMMAGITIDWEKLYPFEEGKKDTHPAISSFYDYVKERLQNMLPRICSAITR